MEAAIGFGIRPEVRAFRINLPGVLQIRLECFCVVVRVNEIVARVVWGSI
jgi:hypothetical protein